jgi:hypothetical protein
LIVNVTMPMKTSLLGAVLLAVSAACALPAHAGLFDDDEARKAILDIRARLDNLRRDVDAKADKNSLLDVASQNEQLRQEVAKLRGQIEVLTSIRGYASSNLKS